MDRIQIDVWSDISCPWCFIGKRNLEAGIKQTESDPSPPVVHVQFHSYQLSPDAPSTYSAEYIAARMLARGITDTQVAQSRARVVSAAEEAGLTYRLDLAIPTNTHKAHELIHFARKQSLQLEMTERLMSAQLSEGKHLGQIDVLVQLAAEVGLDEGDARHALEAGEFAGHVEQDRNRASTYGISSVPFFVLDDRYGVSGAQSPDAFARTIRYLWSQRLEADPQTPG